MPDEALVRERICRTVSDVFSAHGYRPVETPLLEERSVLSQYSSADGAAFQLFDGSGHLLMLRTDMTMPIARMASTRLDFSAGPVRLRYTAPIVREQAEYAGLPRQSTQLGLELIGQAGADADAEVVALAAEALTSAGVEDWRIVCGSVEPMTSLLAACVPDAGDRERLLALVHASDFVGLDAFAATLPVADRVRRTVCALPRVWGGSDALDEAAALLEPYVAGDGGIGQLRTLFEAARRAGFADRLSVDFSVMNSFGYYTGLVFSAYAEGVAAPIASGGRYDGAFARFGGSPVAAAGFAISLEAVEEALACEDVSAGGRRPLRIAVPKGSLFAETVDLLSRAGLDVEGLRDPGRHLIVRTPEAEFIIVRPTDAPAFVASGGADCGICGLDSLVEAGFDLVQLLDLGYGACRFVVAGPRAAAHSLEDIAARRGSIRVSTKYPRIAKAHFDRRGLQADIVTLHGNIELGPLVGMTDCIVDITATGTTLRENDLEELDGVMACSARFFASPARVRCDSRIRALARAFVAQQQVSGGAAV